MSKRSLQQQIHVACRDLGLDTEARHAVQLAATGKASMSGMSVSDLQLVVDHLKAHGWTPSAGKNRKPRAPRRDLRLAHKLWSLLGEAGALEKPDRAGLNAFVRHQFEGKWQSVPLDIDVLTDPGQINDVISALKAWCRRAGVELKR